MSEQRTSEKPRRYTSRLREQQAAATRERIIRAATELFAARGYAGTSLPQIARAAGVSTETVQAQGPKIRLLYDAMDLAAFATRGEVPVLESELGAEYRSAQTPDEAVAISARILTTINRGSHGLWLALSEASRTDEELAQSFRDLVIGLRTESLTILRLWRDRGWLRDDVADDELRRWADLIGSVEVYDRLVRIEGSSQEEYEALIARLLRELMLPR